MMAKQDGCGGDTVRASWAFRSIAPVMTIPKRGRIRGEGDSQMKSEPMSEKVQKEEYICQGWPDTPLGQIVGLWQEG